MHIIHILKDPKMSTMRATGRLYLRHSFWFVASSTFHAGDAAKAVCVWSGRRMMVAVCLVLAFAGGKRHEHGHDANVFF